MAFLILTCTEIGRKKRGKSDNFEFGPPNVGCDLSKVVVLQRAENIKIKGAGQEKGNYYCILFIIFFTVEFFFQYMSHTNPGTVVTADNADSYLCDPIH